MTKYLKVVIEGKYESETHYMELEDKEYTDSELLQIGQDCVNEQYSWGQSVVDESEVPEGEI